ncbi:MAG: sigma-70 family RNA polymerase sigma factor [Firmicutes bacterium]|nr:sigma-70 family RNA polymerase sigma factor [Bacillota bacterium]MCM1401944.1 sigma-70 family RNA polymerase sigma factor [Bacteroides sp.]MCM1477851.1 sigma-70 family RNA polymerase sigma factor [Bacteroides sp.]
MLHKIFQQQLLGMQTHLYNFAYLLTSNREDASDLLQDTTLKALDNEDKYHDNTNFKGWVFTIMRNIFINNYRRAVKSVVTLDNSDDSYQLNTADDRTTYPSPENSYTVIEVHNAIQSFPDGYRIPFSMALAGYRYSEIAKRMALPVGTVKSRIFYARHRLRDMLKDYA